MLRSALSWENAWRIRVAALSFIVICVGIGSQILVNEVVANFDATTMATGTTLKVTAYTTIRRMADGNWTHVGACAVAEAQFSLGTVLALYDADGRFNRQCTVEDMDSSIDYDHIELAMPGDAEGTVQWGVRFLAVRVVRLGWGPDAPPNLSANSVTPMPIMHLTKPWSLWIKSRLK